MKASTKILLSLMCGALVLAGCSKKAEESASASTTVSGASSDENNSHPKDMLRVDVGDEVPTLDPQIGQDTTSARISYDLFSGLVDFDQKNNPIPGLAEKWDISSDGKTYTFHLRKGLKFSNGTPITSKDFVFSFQRLVDPKVASPYNWLLSNVVNGSDIIKSKMPNTQLGVSAPDDYTFVVKLVNPDPTFIARCTMPNLVVVPRDIINKYGDKWTNTENIVGSGAYMLTEHVVKGYILAVKNPNYYDAKNVAIDKVKFFPYTDTNASVASYKSGGLDTTWQSLPVDQYKALKTEYPKEVHSVLQEAIYYYDFNMKSPEIKGNLKLRQALTMAIDRATLVDQVLSQGQPALYSNATPTVENGQYANVKYDWSTLPYDKQLAQAKELFKQAGYGPEHPFKVNISYNTNDLHKKAALAVASMWTSAFGNGIKVTADNQEWKTFIQARMKGDYQIARDGWVADYNSITSYTQLYQCGNDTNNSHYCNSAYDDLLKQADGTSDKAKQQQLYTQALTMALNDYAIIPLFQYTYTRLVKPYVANYQIDGNSLDHVQTKWFSFSDAK